MTYEHSGLQLHHKQCTQGNMKGWKGLRDKHMQAACTQSPRHNKSTMHEVSTLLTQILPVSCWDTLPIALSSMTLSVHAPETALKRLCRFLSPETVGYSEDGRKQHGLFLTWNFVTRLSLFLTKDANCRTDSLNSLLAAFLSFLFSSSIARLTCKNNWWHYWAFCSCTLITSQLALSDSHTTSGRIQV